MKTVEELHTELEQLSENQPEVSDKMYITWLKQITSVRKEIQQAKDRNKQRKPV